MNELNSILKSEHRNFDKINGKISITKNSIEKSINRNSKKVAAQSRKSMIAILTECGGGNTPFAHSKDLSVDGVLFRHNKEIYPKEVTPFKHAKFAIAWLSPWPIHPHILYFLYMKYTIKVLNQYGKIIASATFSNKNNADQYSDYLLGKSIPHQYLINNTIYSEYEA